MTNPFQFSIRGVMFVTAATAAAVAVLGGPTSVIQAIGIELLAILFFSISFVTAQEAAGAHRRFWTGFAICTGFGAAFSTISLPYLILLVTDEPSKSALVISVADFSALLVPAFWLFAPINGLMCVAIHWFVRSR